MNTTSIRVLRWVYAQHDESVTCELQLADDGLSYQLTTTPCPQHGVAELERFKDVTSAFQRQCELERKLIADGWSLETYEAQVRAVDADGNGSGPKTGDGRSNKG